MSWSFFYFRIPSPPPSLPPPPFCPGPEASYLYIKLLILVQPHKFQLGSSLLGNHLLGHTTKESRQREPLSSSLRYKRIHHESPS